ncbi:MAG: DUF2608 domain-containing protein [Endozoicomonadaceae bacterium]|nr:DUF2608 domain-containing protein [Endozoicomonadaceae bacterium]
MQKIFSFITTLILLFISLTVLAGKDNTIKQQGGDYSKTSTPGAFLLDWMKKQPLTKDTLILLDLDETVLSTSADGWLYPNNYYSLCEEQIKKHPELSSVNVELRVTPLFTHAAFLNRDFHLTDEQLPEAIELLKSEGCTVLGFTSRENDLIPDTIKWLQKLNVNFSQVPDDEIEMGKDRHPLFIKKGVVFIGVTSTKGEALTKLLDSGKLQKPDNILFIDDRISNLETTTEAVTKRKDPIVFFPVLSTYPQITFKPYDSKAVNNALLRFLVDNIEDNEIKALLENDAYTKELVTEQCEKRDDAEIISLCDTLKAKSCKWQRKEKSLSCKNTITGTQ